MKGLSSGLLAEKAGSANTPFYLVKIDNTYFYTDCDQPITYDSNTYNPAPLQVDGFRSSSDLPLDGGSIKIGNVDLVFSSLVLNGSLANKNVFVYEVYLDSSFEVVDAELLFEGRIEGQSLTEKWAALTCTPFRYKWGSMTPRRRIVRQCGWMFKSGRCSYSGVDTLCNKTWEDCTSKSNTARFGGFRFLPERGVKFTWGNTIIEVK